MIKSHSAAAFQSSMLPLLNCRLPSVFRFLKNASPPPDELPDGEYTYEVHSSQGERERGVDKYIAFAGKQKALR